MRYLCFHAYAFEGKRNFLLPLQSALCGCRIRKLPLSARSEPGEGGSGCCRRNGCRREVRMPPIKARVQEDDCPLGRALDELRGGFPPQSVRTADISRCRCHCRRNHRYHKIPQISLLLHHTVKTPKIFSLQGHKRIEYQTRYRGGLNQSLVDTCVVFFLFLVTESDVIMKRSKSKLFQKQQNISF